MHNEGLPPSEIIQNLHTFLTVSFPTVRTCLKSDVIVYLLSFALFPKMRSQKKTHRKKK